MQPPPAAAASRFTNCSQPHCCKYDSNCKARQAEFQQLKNFWQRLSDDGQHHQHHHHHHRHHHNRYQQQLSSPTPNTTPGPQAGAQSQRQQQRRISADSHHHHRQHLHQRTVSLSLGEQCSGAVDTAAAAADVTHLRNEGQKSGRDAKSSGVQGRNNNNSECSSISDRSGTERAEIFLRDQQEKLLDRAKYQSVFDERVGPLDFEASCILDEISDDEDDDDTLCHSTSDPSPTTPSSTTAATPFSRGGAVLVEEEEEEEEQQRQQQASATVPTQSAVAGGEADELTGRLTGNGPSRTPWSSMTEVKQAGLLELMSKEEVKLQEAQFEIITSEASYYKNLTFLIEHFYKNDRLDHTRPNSLLRALDKHYLFSNIVDIFNCSANFLKSMEDEWKKSPRVDFISQVVLNHIDRLQVYKDYCRNFYYQTKTLHKLCNNQQFLQLLQQLQQSPACRGIPLQSYLEMPMKRIMSLQLLMDAVMRRIRDDNPNYGIALRTLGELLNLAKECDLESKMMSEKEQMLQLQNKLVFPRVKKVGCWGSGRHLVKEGQLRVLSAVPNTQGFLPRVSIKRRYVQLHAFSDLLLVSKAKGISEYHVLKHCPRSFVDAEIIASPNSHHHQHQQQQQLQQSPQPQQQPQQQQQQHQQQQHKRYLRLRILDRSDGSPEVTLTLETRSAEEADRWLAVFCPRDELGDPVYDPDDCPQVKVVHACKPQQKDDLELRVGEILNVYKKTDSDWFLGSKITDPNLRGWFNANNVVEIENDHYRAKIRKVSFRRKIALQTAAVNANLPVT